MFVDLAMRHISMIKLGQLSINSTSISKLKWLPLNYRYRQLVADPRLVFVDMAMQHISMMKAGQLSINGTSISR